MGEATGERVLQEMEHSEEFASRHVEVVAEPTSNDLGMLALCFDPVVFVLNLLSSA